MTDERIKELAKKWCLYPTDNAWDEVMGFAYDLIAEDALQKLADIDHSLGLYGDSVNMNQERVDETAKRERSQC